MSLLIFLLFIGIFNKYSNGNPENLKFPSNDIPPELKSVSCQGQNSSCPNSETCCQLESGQYGCCPLSDAICCSDHLHCCPKGYTCDVEHSTCQKGSEKPHDVVCPGGEMTCADGETCYQLESSHYDCCPLPDAVLCSDSIHCCPHGYTCDVKENKCEKGVLIPWFTTKEATPLNFPKQLIRTLSLTPLSIFDEQTCPDGITKCSSSSTCCPNKNNGEISYSCCPYARGACCGSLCCPNKYICNEDDLSCQLDETISAETETVNRCRVSNAPSPDDKGCLCNPGQQRCPSGICCPTGTCNSRGGCSSL